MRKLIFIVAIIISTSNIAHAYETSKETYCAQAFGFSTLDEMKKELLLNAKRSAVNKLFGELIMASTSVENLVLTSDQIRASSIGFVRIEGDLSYFHGKNLGEICVQATAYATEEDKEKFKPIRVSKRACASDSGSSAKNLKITAEKNAINTALIEYERRLSELDPDVLLRLMRQVAFSESGFVPDTETYCTRATGIVYPIEIIAATSALTEDEMKNNKGQKEERSSKDEASKKVKDKRDVFIFEPANYWGHEIEVIRDFTDPQECARRCAENPQCKVASYHGPNANGGWANTCVCRDKIGPRHTEQIDIRSWIKKEVDTEPSSAQSFPKITLTRAKNVGEAKGTLIAPGNGKQKYTIHLIDTKDFSNGGNITFRISVGGGESNASFDLFPEGVQIPTTGRPKGSVVGRYDVSKGSTVTMSYRFQHGQVFQFGAGGNWFSRKDSQNTYTFDVRVTE